MRSSSYTEDIHTMSTNTILYCAYSILYVCMYVCMYKCYIDDISEDDISEDVYILADVCGMRLYIARLLWEVRTESGRQV